MGLLSGVRHDIETYLVELLKTAQVETQRGAILLAPHKRNLDDLEQSLPRRKAEYGLDDYVIGRERLAEEFGGLVDKHFAGALVMPDAQHVQPAEMMQQLAKFATSIGVTVCENAAVRDWSPEDGRIRVDTVRGDLTAGKLLLAGGGYVDRCCKTLWRQTLAVPSVAAASEELDNEVIADLLPGRKLAVINRFRGYNLRLSTDGRRILLAGPVADRPRSVEQDLRRLKSYFVGLLPALADVNFTHCWTGMSGVTRDRVTHIGRNDGAWFVTGSSGLANSAVAGRDAAEKMLAGGESAQAFPEWAVRPAERIWWGVIRYSAKLLDATGRSRLR